MRRPQSHGLVTVALALPFAVLQVTPLFHELVQLTAWAALGVFLLLSIGVLLCWLTTR